MSRNAPSFACNTYSYTIAYSAEDCLVRLADLGFAEFELMMYPGHLWPPETNDAQRAVLRRLIAGRGLRVATLNMPNIDMNVAGASAERRRYTLDLLRQIVELASDLEVPGVVVGPGKANPLFPPARTPRRVFLRRARRARPARQEGRHGALGREYAVCVHSRHRGPDAGPRPLWQRRHRHSLRRGQRPLHQGEFGDALRRCRNRLKLVHISDTGQQVYRHDPVGAGNYPFPEVPPVLEEIGHKRLPMLEIIAPDAEKGILASADTLAAMGYGRA